MARFLAEGSRKRTRVIDRSEPGPQAWADAEAYRMVCSGKYHTVTVLRDSEGEDHPDNAGKFFLHRIVK